MKLTKLVRASGGNGTAADGVELTAEYSRVLTLLRVVLAALGGVLVFMSFPPVAWWFTAPFGIALFIVSLTPWDLGPRPKPGSKFERHTAHIPGSWTSLGLGIVFGMAFFGPLLPWVGMYVGWYAAVGLAFVQSLYTAVFALGASTMVRVLHRSTMTTLNYLSTALFLPAWWIAIEFLRSSWPWNGFPWGRLAFGQANGPFVFLTPITTTPGLSYVVALIGATLAIFVVSWQWRHVTAPSSYRAPITLAGYVVVLLAVTSGLAMTPLANGSKHPDDSSPLNVAAIQGNVPRTGLDFNSQRFQVLQNHVDETLRLADEVKAGTAEQPDIVLWPENAADVNPVYNETARELVDEATEAINAPIIVGSVIPTGTEESPAATNSMLVWEPDVGETARHDKYFVQPFGEWLPWRGFWEKLFPIAERAGYFVPGAPDWTLRIGDTTVGVATCFEIAFTRAATDAVNDGARILTVPTNNATFGESPMTYQQLAMSRVQAVEHHIPVVVASTNGVSAVINERGRIQSETELSTAATLTASFGDVPTGTLATRLGAKVEYVLAFFGFLGALFAMFVIHRLPPLERRRRQSTV